MFTWMIAGMIASIPFIPWSRLWSQFLSWFDRVVPDARKDIEYKIKQAQIDWLTYEKVMLVFFMGQCLVVILWFSDWSTRWNWLLILLSVSPWYFLRWWGNRVKEAVKMELADFYRALRQLLASGAHPDEALASSIEHVHYLKDPLQRILVSWGDPVGTKETLNQIYELYSDSDIKNMVNLLESILLNYQDHMTLQTMESQEILIRDLKEHTEETRDEAERERLETLSTMIVLAQIFVVILPVVMDTVQQMQNIAN